MGSHEEVREELIETDEEFRRLYREHQGFEKRLITLSDNPTPSADDELVVKGIKVQKLHLKDRMEAIIRGHC